MKTASGKMTLLECQQIAKGYDSGIVTFEFCGPAGSRKAEWVDADLGTFRLEREEKLLQVNMDLPCGMKLSEADSFWCDNIQTTSLN